MSETKFIPVHTYSDLASYVDAFAKGTFRFLAIWGTGGIGKTETVLSLLNPIPEPSREDMKLDDDDDIDSTLFRGWVNDWTSNYDGATCRYLKGNLSAIELYSDLWRYKDQVFVLDDTDLQESGPQAIKMLKSVCESRGDNKVFWKTQNKTLQAEGIPREFKTKSRLLVLTNEWNADNAHLAAVADRGIILRFTPTAATVHQRVIECDIIKDSEVLEYVGSNLARIVTPSIRSYLSAVELKSIGKDWRSFLDMQFNPTTDFEIWIQIHESRRYRLKKDEIKAFSDKTGASRRTWFNYQDRYASMKSAKGEALTMEREQPQCVERPVFSVKADQETNELGFLADKYDFYASDAETVRYLLDREQFDGEVMEPCSGDGAITEILGEYGYDVVASDLRESGIVGRGGVNLFDLSHAVNIATNPPFTDFGAVVEHLVSIAERKVACLLPLRFLGSKGKTTVPGIESPSACLFTAAPTDFLCWWKGLWKSPTSRLGLRMVRMGQGGERQDRTLVRMTRPKNDVARRQLLRATS